MIHQLASRRSPLFPLVLGTLALGFVTLACQGPAAVRLPDSASEYDPNKLASAVEAFYAAPDAETMRAAVEEAKKHGPDSAYYHEIAAKLARLEGHTLDAFDHLLAALLDPSSDAAHHHLETLAGLFSRTLEGQRRAMGVLEAVRVSHPDQEVRARAAWFEAQVAHLLGNKKRRDHALNEVRPLPLAVIGTWDNDQGKGFELEYPPERGIDLDASYSGYRVEAEWRTDAPVHPHGYVAISTLMHPDRWQVAYGAVAVAVDSPGSYELRVTTSAPIKVWVNDLLVFENRRLGGNGLFDGVVIPVELDDGANRILIKSAQERGSWRLLTRLTGSQGDPIDEGSLTILSPDATPKRAGTSEYQPISDSDLISRPFLQLENMPARRAKLESKWSGWLGLRAPRVEIAERFNSDFPDSLWSQLELAGATWNNQERDRASDILARLSFPREEAFPETLTYQARFWRQQNLDTQARELLFWLRDHSPHHAEAWWKLARFMREENWHEERCRALEQMLILKPDSTRATREFARCQASLGYQDRAIAIYESYLKEVPSSSQAIRYLHQNALQQGRYRRALRYAEQRVEAWPTSLNAWLMLGNSLRVTGRQEQAEAAFQEVVRLSPAWARGYERLGRLALERGDTEEAARLFKKALDRNPEAEKLAERISLLVPDDDGPWIKDVPDYTEIQRILDGRETIEAHDGSDIVILLEDTVTHLSGDKVATTFVTYVARALNENGRDRLTRLRLRPGRHHRILHAYALDPEGRRIDATSVRGRDVRYRELAIGATVVLQYRVEERRQRFLDGHYSRRQFFNRPTEQTVNGRWVLWAPPDTVFNEDVHHLIERTEEQREDYLRVSWKGRDLPPIIHEPHSPSPDEIAVSVAISTVPDWESFASWERALLMDAFRSSPEIDAFVHELVDGADSKEEKLSRIYDFVIQDIRYQQDYDRPITGVKPHAAPVVFARRYGDCKDKAVLLITMAEKVGIDARFALVRTRPRGPVRKTVPMQQFNHAIVYVPAQEGIDAERFLDPTVDGLDLSVLRQDNQGTTALVFDLAERSISWIEVPFQEPEVNFTLIEMTKRLEQELGLVGESRLTSQGMLASIIRRQARNPEILSRFIEGFLGQMLSGARLQSFDGPHETDLRTPVMMDIYFSGDDIVRQDGDTLRIPLPLRTVPVANAFRLQHRSYPLVLGPPNLFRTRVEIELPEGMGFERLPSKALIETKCISVERTVEMRDDRALIEQSFSYTCERILPEDYSDHRVAMDRIQSLLTDEIVLSPSDDD